MLPDASGVWNCYEDPISIKDMYYEVKSNEDIESGTEIALKGEVVGVILLKTVENFGSFCMCRTRL